MILRVNSTEYTRSLSDLKCKDMEGDLSKTQHTWRLHDRVAPVRRGSAPYHSGLHGAVGVRVQLCRVSGVTRRYWTWQTKRLLETSYKLSRKRREDLIEYLKKANHRWEYSKLPLICEQIIRFAAYPQSPSWS